MSKNYELVSALICYATAFGLAALASAFQNDETLLHGVVGSGMAGIYWTARIWFPVKPPATNPAAPSDSI